MQQLRLRFYHVTRPYVVNLPSPPTGRNPVPALYQITALRQRKGTCGAQQFSFFDVSKQLIQLATLLRFKSTADDDLI